ncbi:MAG: T9SS type A sorting domain-containing protein [Cyclonatronaceae bacterium]
MLFVKQPSSTHIACLAFVFSLLCPFLLFSQENPDSLLAYYPLHIGNIWEYEEVEYDEFMLPVSTDYSRIRVIGDTLMPNAHTYRVLEYHKLLNRETELKYERVDSTTGNVYRFLPDLDSDLLIDSLFAQPFEYSLANRFERVILRTAYRDEFECTIFERLLMCKSYQVETAIPISYVLTKDIGLTYYSEIENSGSITEIIYARVNDQEYGERAPVSIDQDPGNIPVEFGLIRNYPNPFNPATRIIYRLDQSGPVTLELFDIQGRRVARLVEDGNRSAGTHTVEWNARGMASGMYLAVLRSGTAVDTIKILLLR